MKNGNGKMVHYKDYVAGWLDSSIREFLEELTDVPASMAYALVTCLDSNLNPAALVRKSAELRSMARSISVTGESILMPTKALLETNTKSPIFFGFDEIWFLPSDEIESKPDTAWLVGPNRINSQKLRRLGPWMMRCNCTLALGDGEGLNVVVKAGGMAKHLIAHSLSQPQHALSGEIE